VEDLMDISTLSRYSAAASLVVGSLALAVPIGYVDGDQPGATQLREAAAHAGMAKLGNALLAVQILVVPAMVYVARLARGRAPRVAFVGGGLAALGWLAALMGLGTTEILVYQGARGYVLKGADPDTILRSILVVAAGEAIFGSAVASRLTQFFATGGGTQAATPFPDLTSRERDILGLMATGASNQTIAHRLGLTEKTVRNNVSNVLTKLRVADRAAAVARARDAGLGQSV
jgi:DNA-binding CsgD family transcriptional regulator